MDFATYPRFTRVVSYRGKMLFSYQFLRHMGIETTLKLYPIKRDSQDENFCDTITAISIEDENGRNYRWQKG